MLYSHKRNRGFTLVELLIVIVVIVVLAAITISVYAGTQERARNVHMLSMFDGYEKALSIYYLRTNTYPSVVGNTIACLGEYPATSDFAAGTCRVTTLSGQPSVVSSENALSIPRLKLCLVTKNPLPMPARSITAHIPVSPDSSIV